MLSEKLPEKSAARFSKKARRRTIVAVSAVALLGGVGVLRHFLKELPKVDFVRVEKGRVQELVSAITQGTVVAERHVSLPIYVNAAVTQLPHVEGSLLKAGELIAAFDDHEARLALQAREASLAAAVAQQKSADTQRENARREMVRSESLAKEGALSEAALDRIRDTENAAIEQAALALANVQAQKTAVQQAQLYLQRHRIVAPFDGLLVRLDLSVGELPKAVASSGVASTGAAAALGVSVAKESGPIQLVDPQGLYVEAYIDERDIGRVAVGQVAELTLDALGDAKIFGKVSYVRPLIEVMGDKTRQVAVHIQPDDTSRLRAGMGADTEIVVAERDNVLRLPSQVVLRQEGKHLVYVLSNDTLNKRDVEQGLSSWQASEIVSGLAAGDLVAWPPDDLELKDEMRVLPGVDKTTDSSPKSAAGSQAEARAP